MADDPTRSDGPDGGDPNRGSPTDGGPLDDVDDRLDELHEHLAATGERPVARSASAHLGEAEAVARDLAERPADADTVRERAGHVVRLLEEAGETEDDEADERVERALSIARELSAEDDSDG